MGTEDKENSTTGGFRKSEGGGWIKNGFIMNRKNERYREDLHEYRCDERLKVNPERSTRLVYTGWCEGMEHLKIKTRLINERFVSVMGECVTWTPQVRTCCLL